MATPEVRFKRHDWVQCVKDAPSSLDPRLSYCVVRVIPASPQYVPPGGQPVPGKLCAAHPDILYVRTVRSNSVRPYSGFWFKPPKRIAEGE